MTLPALSLPSEAQQHGSTLQATHTHSASRSVVPSPGRLHHAEGNSNRQHAQSLKTAALLEAAHTQKAQASAASSSADSAMAAAASEANDAICVVGLHATAQTASLTALHNAAPFPSSQEQLSHSPQTSANTLLLPQSSITASEDAALSYSAAGVASADTASAAEETEPVSVYAACATIHALPDVTGSAIAFEASSKTAAESDIFGLLADSTFVSNLPFASLNASQAAMFRMLANDGPDQPQQQTLLPPLVTALGSVKVDTEEAVTPQRRNSEEQPGQDVAQTSLQTTPQTDSAENVPLSTASNAEVVSQTAHLESLPPTVSLESADSATSAAVAAASDSQPPLQLWPLPLMQPSVPSSAQLGTLLDRSVSESALLSDVQSEPLKSAPAKPKRQSLLALLRPRRLSQGGLEGPALWRTASDPSLLTRQSSADLGQNQKLVKRRSLLGMLRRGSSAAVAENSSGPDAVAAAIPIDPVEVAAVGTATSPQEEKAGTYPQAVVGILPQQSTSVGAGTLPDQAVDLQPQSAPASPRGRTGTALGPQGSALLPVLAPGRTLSDPSMLIRLPSGMYGIPTTPRRMSLLGRLSRGRRSNSIAPEPGQLEAAPDQLPLEDVPFAEQPFAEPSALEGASDKERSDEEDQKLSKQRLVKLALPEEPSTLQLAASELPKAYQQGSHKEAAQGDTLQIPFRFSPALISVVLAKLVNLPAQMLCLAE